MPAIFDPTRARHVTSQTKSFLLFVATWMFSISDSKLDERDASRSPGSGDEIINSGMVMAFTSAKRHRCCDVNR